jgi:gas vesicle protein
MADLKKQAKRARKQLDHLDFDVSALRGHLPKDFDLSELNFVKKREDEAATRGFIGGFLLGILAGAVLALIFTPKRGEETREIVAHTAVDLKDKATELVHQVRSGEENADGQGENVDSATAPGNVEEASQPSQA